MVRRLAMPAASAAAVWGAVQLLAWGTGALLGPVRGGTAGLNELLGLAAALAAWVVLAWVVAVLLSTAVAALPGVLGRAGARVVHRLAPAAARSAARLAVGFAVSAGPLAGATVAAAAFPAGPDVGTYAQTVDVSELPGVGRPGQPVPPGNAREPGSSPTDLSPTATDPSPAATDPSPTATDPSPAATDPSRTAAADDVPWPGASSTGRTNAGSGTTEAGQTAAAPLAPAPVRETDPGDEVVVQRGDTLWAIAARHLGPDATVAEIAAEWPRWYATNRTVIGDDPDLILPGTILHPPLDD